MQELTITGTSRNEASSPSATKAGRRPLHEMLTPFPFAYFTAALLTDIAYWRSDEVMWQRFSVWLITGGLVMSALLAIAAIIDLIGGEQKPARFRVPTYVVAVLVALTITVAYANASAFSRWAGREGTRVITRLSAFLLMCVGVQIVLTGVTDALPGLVARASQEQP